ncbi:MAG: hypothetical protein K2N48_04525 [Muribaculaceae bacterium]|nr:hypothetical protein [Muribaculaceae bacterium]
MEYKYNILSSVDDFYMADAICRELEKVGSRCYFNLRDSKTADKLPDCYDNIGSSTSIIAVVNDDFLSNHSLSSVIPFYSKKTSNDKVFIVQNGPISEYPAKWADFGLVDATKGLNSEILSIIRGDVSKDVRVEEKEELTVSASPVMATSFNNGSATKKVTDPIQIPNVEEACCRVSKPSIHDLIEMKDGLSLTLQRAVRYLKGDGVPQDDERAYSLFKKAVTENPDDYKAQYCFGVCSELEYGGGKKTEAVYAYKRAFELGEDEVAKHAANTRIAMVKYENGEYIEARELFTKIAQVDPISSSFGLGLIDEAEAKYEDAVEHYSEAAELGNLPAQNALGCLYAEGKGVNQNDRKALQWFVMAANNGLTEAMVNAGIRLIEYDDEEFKATGEAMLQEAANRGNQIARIHMLEVEDRRIAEKRKLELERKRQEQTRHGDDDNSNNGGNGRSAWGAFLDGLDLPGLAGYAKGRLFD